METIDTLLRDVPVFDGLPADDLTLLAGCAHNVHFDAGAMLFREGDAADTFYLIRHGSVALEMYVPARGPAIIETLEAGEVVGWSWLFPPYRWHFDARALTPVLAPPPSTVPASAGKCEEDPRLGYD